MATSYSPKIITDGLAFMYDTDDGKSYKGEPTTNIVPTPNANARFTTSNNWQTYNTNQYNSNTYFSIGTVSSVSNNIVTLGSVGRTIRSFDVLRPETTGGGVIAGAAYVIKKISSTTFSLHEYNSSQNGSQGYINPDTGFHKVHDAYANDTKITINATNFPTSWWGPPHLPNSGLIKEIVEGGGRVSGTNAMRLHVYRDDGVVDGMAYGVYCPVTVGDVITISVWLKRADSRGEGKSIGYSTYFGSGYSGSSTSFGSLNTEWTKYQYTWTASNTLSFYSYWWPNGTTAPYAIDMCDFQVEINGHATQFTTGTRSATQGLIDRTGNSTIDLSNASFDSNAQMVFDGTDDYAAIPYSSTDLDGDAIFSVEAIIKRTGTMSNGGIWGIGGDGTAAGINGYVYTSAPNKITIDLWGTATFHAGVDYPLNEYVHVTWVKTTTGFSTSTIIIYVNGVAYTGSNLTVMRGSSHTPNLNTSTSGKGIVIGRGGPATNLYYAPGEMPIFKVYNKALTSAEVLQNYNATKGRFS